MTRHYTVFILVGDIDEEIDIAKFQKLTYKKPEQ